LRQQQEASERAFAVARSYYETQIANRDEAIAELRQQQEASERAFAVARSYYETQIANRDEAIAESKSTTFS
jgi:hypothetical protein